MARNAQNLLFPNPGKHFVEFFDYEWNFVIFWIQCGPGFEIDPRIWKLSLFWLYSMFFCHASRLSIFA